jgi:sterol desaturase/sphingolipid hydroxylase (fatty acid hydroxylase superfamily)
MFMFYMLGANLRHSHVWLPYPKWLSHILISPAQHQIHHSQLIHHHDKNFGLMFAIWDWIMGTLYVPKHRENYVWGLDHGEDRDYQTVTNLYVVPFKKAWALLRKPRRRELEAAKPEVVT